MLFSRSLFFLAASYITFSSAIPVPRGDELSLANREPSDLDFDDVSLIARGPTTNQVANKMVAAQGKRVAQKVEKATLNNAIPGDAKAKNQAIRTAQQEAKDKRKEKWDNKAQAKASNPPKAREPKPAGTPKQPRPEALRKPGEIRAAKAEKKDQRKAAGNDLKAAATRMKSTQDIPDRRTTHTVATEQRSGRDVRQSVMLSHLNQNDPIAHGKKTEYPKTIKPYPDPNYVAKTKAAGQYVVPPEGVREYPIKQDGGWTGGKPGPMRTLTTTSAPDRLDAVVGHDSSKKGGSTNHYPAVQSRELDELDFEY